MEKIISKNNREICIWKTTTEEIVQDLQTFHNIDHRKRQENTRISRELQDYATCGITTGIWGYFGNGGDK